MPDRSEILPQTLVPLIKYQAMDMTHARFNVDIGFLLSTVERVLIVETQQSRPTS